MPTSIPQVFKHKGKALKGKSAKPTAYTPGMMPGAAVAIDDLTKLDRKRPANSRFPISEGDFAKLEAAASTAKLKAKLKAHLVVDKAGKAELASAPGMLAPMAPMALLEPAPITTTPGTPLGNFAGIADTGWFPPDCTMAVGPEHVLVSVNSSFSVYTKAGALVLGPQTLSNWFSSVITSAKIFDPKAIFDQHSNRWFLLAVALPSDPASQQSFFLLSVSQTADPLGAWWNYKLDATLDGQTATTNWADYPSLGVDNTALYITANMFKFNGGYQYAKVRVLPKTPLLTGAAATWWDFTKLKNGDGSLAFTVQPCHTYGAPQVEYLVNSYFTGATTENKLTLWSLTFSAGTPSITGSTISTSAYGQPPVADQKGGGAGLNAGDVRVLNAVSRGGSVWCALTTFHNWGETVNRAAIHWFQINATSGALVQEGIYGASGNHYFYPAVMPDTNGNMAMVFCRSSSTQFAGIYYTGRRSSDPLGNLQASALLKAGVGNSQRLDGFGRNRWGDYAGIAIDPLDQRNFWFYSMYGETGNKWGTWIGAARY